MRILSYCGHAADRTSGKPVADELFLSMFATLMV